MVELVVPNLGLEQQERVRDSLLDFLLDDFGRERELVGHGG